MTDEARLLALLEEALALDPAERDAFLDRACAGDAALRRRIDEMLGLESRAESFLKPLTPPVADRSGESVGPWRLVHELGRGGMGCVYLAERADALYAKRVAVKLLRFDFGDLRARFANERHILATLDHPNIARLLDAGLDARGAPYVAMEYVEGRPITRWCDEHHLGVRERVALFIEVLEAVQSAHGRLIVHRDLKPANILVDDGGHPKLLDFGIAKLIDQDSAGLTMTGAAPLTPEYASPEQVRGEPTGTASDIYALGVLLYELLAGRRPYEIASTAPAAIESAVCQTIPARPSTIAAANGRARVDRDLDNVTLKALAKSPAERYASCAQFGDDLRRFLAGQPVIATHASWRYRARKFVQRYRVPVAVATLVSLALAASAGIALRQAGIARSEARDAGAARDKAERVNTFLQGMLAAADPGDLGRKATVLDVLERARRQAERELGRDPEALVATEITLAKTYTALGDLDAARDCANIAVRASRSIDDAQTAIDAELTLGATLVARGDFAGAGTVLESARKAALSDGTPRQRGDSANQMGLLEDARGHAAEAERWLDTALAELPPDARDARAEALNDLALIKGTRNDFAGALAAQRESVALLREAYPKGHPLLAQSLSNLAASLDDNGQREAAGKAYAEALRMRIDLLGEDHPGVVSTLSSMTWHDIVGKDIPAAIEHGARAWSLAQKLPPDHPAAGYAANVYAQALLLADRAKEAVPLLETSLRIRKSRYPADHPLVVNTESALGLAEALAGDVANGETLARSAYEQQRAKLGDANEMTIAAHDRLKRIEALPRAKH